MSGSSLPGHLILKLQSSCLGELLCDSAYSCIKRKSLGSATVPHESNLSDSVNFYII